MQKKKVISTENGYFAHPNFEQSLFITLDK